MLWLSGSLHSQSSGQAEAVVPLSVPSGMVTETSPSLSSLGQALLFLPCYLQCHPSSSWACTNARGLEPFSTDVDVLPDNLGECGKDKCACARDCRQLKKKGLQQLLFHSWRKNLNKILQGPLTFIVFHLRKDCIDHYSFLLLSKFLLSFCCVRANCSSFLHAFQVATGLIFIALIQL